MPNKLQTANIEACIEYTVVRGEPVRASRARAELAALREMMAELEKAENDEIARLNKRLATLEAGLKRIAEVAAPGDPFEIVGNILPDIASFASNLISSPPPETADAG